MATLRSAALLTSALLASCSVHWLTGTIDGVPPIDRSRPVAIVEVRGELPKLGATTNEGVVFMNKNNVTGPCRVHFFRAGDLVIDDGTVHRFGGVYHRADIVLKTQAVPVLTRDLTPEDELVAIVLEGREAVRVNVELTTHPDVQGYALDWPGRALPEGTPIFTYRDGKFADELTFVGLANGAATLKSRLGSHRFITFTGPARMREALAAPHPMFKPREVIHRPDGISLSR